VPPTNQQDHILILAAGRGTRAGGPKALIQVAGKPWWQIQAVRLARTRLPVTWVVSEHVRAEIGPAAKLTMVTADESTPMFASILAGLHDIARRNESDNQLPPIRGVFILPVDVPTPAPEVFAKLSAPVRAPLEGTIPVYRGNGQNGHPLYLKWAIVKEDILGRKPGPEVRLDYLTEGILELIGVDDPNVTANLNTAQDFARWSKLNPDG
jgi:CTP:molybdopterin cytidylyltransferase MocA